MQLFENQSENSENQERMSEMEQEKISKGLEEKLKLPMEEDLNETDDGKFIELWLERQEGIEKRIKENPELKVNISDEYENRILRITRERLIEEFAGKNLEGIDWQKAVNFVREAGLPEAPFIIVDRENDRAKFLEIGKNVKGYPFYPISNEKNGKPEFDELGITDKGCGGRYVNIFGMAIVFKEESYDPIRIERNLVHELVHGGFVDYPARKEFANNGVVVESGVGFIRGDGFGEFLEEAIAAMFEYGFLEKYGGEKIKTRKSAALGLTNLDSGNVILLGKTNKQTVLPLPIKYLTENSEAWDSAPAGYALQLLCEAIPHFKDHFIKARTMPIGMGEIYHDLENLSPDLYSQLQENELDYQEKLAVVIEKTKGSVEKIIEESCQNNEALKNRWEEWLSRTEYELSNNILNIELYIDSYRQHGNALNLKNAISCISIADKIISMPYEFAEKYKEDFAKAKEEVMFYETQMKKAAE